MDKPPEKIYLQVDPEGESATDYYEGVTWCQDRINKNDVEYIRADLVSKKPECNHCYNLESGECVHCGKKK